MGILKGIIDRFRALGKSEKEVSDIIEAAANKATVNPEVEKNRKTGKAGNKGRNDGKGVHRGGIANRRDNGTGKNGDFENE